MTDRKVLVIVGVAIAIVAALVIPAYHWSGYIHSGRYVSEGEIIEVSPGQSMNVRLYNMTASNDKLSTHTFVRISGSVPSDAYVGQDVRIGYKEKGLYTDTSQSVDVQFFSKGNVLTAYILPMVLPVTTANDFAITDVQSDGTLLSYNMSS